MDGRANASGRGCARSGLIRLLWRLVVTFSKERHQHVVQPIETERPRLGVSEYAFLIDHVVCGDCINIAESASSNSLGCRHLQDREQRLQLRRRRAVFRSHRDNLKRPALPLSSSIIAVEKRKLGPAWNTPCGPEIYHHNLAAQIGRVDVGSVEQNQIEIWNRLPHLESLRIGSRCNRKQRERCRHSSQILHSAPVDADGAVARADSQGPNQHCGRAFLEWMEGRMLPGVSAVQQ